MPAKTNNTSLSVHDTWRYLLPVLLISGLVIVAISLAGSFFFFRGRTIMEHALKDKLRSTAAAAAMHFDSKKIMAIQKGDTMESSPQLRDTVDALQSLRVDITNIQFAYIMRKSSVPGHLEFVADADLALTDEELDSNGNGIVDADEESSVPGDLYDWTDFPMLGTEAFLHAAVDETVGDDLWGSIISGYAPIRDPDGQAVAILGIDMDAKDYTVLSQSAFSPIALLLVVLAGVLIGFSVLLFLWKRRMEIIDRLEEERSGLMRLAFHQLGGPLTIISWSIEELETDGPQSIQRTISNIHEGVGRLTKILRMLKEADMIHAGKLDYAPELASLTTVLQSVVKDVGTKLAERRQQIQWELGDNVTMNMDIKLIAGVARELLVNAMDFSEDGATITVRSRHTSRWAEFEIEDTGCGIPRQDMTRIFDEFSRGSNATKYKADGNGLGLYIVHGIVTRAGGKVLIRSEEGTGTTVTVRLPLA